MADGIHEEEVLGKAYDGRLMRRLVRYLRPYCVGRVRHAGLMGRPLRGHEPHAVELEAGGGLTRYSQVGIVHGIERPAEDRQSQRAGVLISES